jgi:hypothetical protein
MIVGKAELRQAIVDAETLATRIRDDARPLTMPERRTAAHLLAGLAEMARRSFDPFARQDWGVMPRPPRETDDVPGVFDERRKP